LPIADCHDCLDIMSPREPLVKKLKADELFNLSFLKQLGQSGFIDQLYQGSDGRMTICFAKAVPISLARECGRDFL
jgi:hypothetical protein